jgi:hypothetical protein
MAMAMAMATGNREQGQEGKRMFVKVRFSSSVFCSIFRLQIFHSVFGMSFFKEEEEEEEEEEERSYEEVYKEEVLMQKRSEF